MNPLVRALRLPFVSALLLCSSAAIAQGPAPRIRGPIEATPSVPLAGSLDPHLRTAQDLGPLAPDTLISGITLVFSRSAAQESALQQLLAQQTNPSSPLYHHWLTPDTFASRFGVAASDVAATTAWLQAFGFIIDPASTPTPDRITFSGTAAQIQQAFGAELHRFRWPAGNDEPSQLHFAPATELLLPPTLAPVTAAVLHLSDFRPKPSVRTLHPDYTTLSTQSHFLVPYDVEVMYDLMPLYSNRISGTGQQLVIVGQSYVNTAGGGSTWTFRGQAGGGNSTPINTVLVPGSGVEAVSAGDEGESEIDLEYSSAIAYSAGVVFVTTGSSQNYDVIDSLSYAVSQDIAPVISVSYGICEPLLSTADAEQINSILEQAAAQGQTVVAASGDFGATGCAAYGSESGLTTAAEQQLAVDLPASSPYAVAVGGTQMAPGTFAAGDTTYWLPAVNLDNSNSLLSYVPEVAWNEGSPTLGILASGGGASIFFVRPSWQANVPGIPSGTFRLVPDVALQASVASPGYAICTDDAALAGTTQTCTNGLKSSTGAYTVTGGTSFAAPIFAGFLAVLNQYESTNGLGDVHPTLYSLAAQPSIYTSAFHDIATGTTACIFGDGNCGTPGESAYAATTGYDQATGLGSLDFYQLALDWPSAHPTALQPTSINFLGTPSTAAPSSNVTLDIGVSPGGNPGNTPPTGNISLALDGTPVSSSIPLTPFAGEGAAYYTLTAPSTTGTHLLTARYPGDATHLPSSYTDVLTVGSLLATGTVSISASNLALSPNSTGVSQIMVNPSGGYNGALTWSASYTGSTAQTICYLIQVPPINGPTTGTLNIGLGTACNTPGALKVPSTVQRAAIEPPAHPPAHPFSGSLPTAAALALLLCIVRPSRRRKLATLLSLAVLATLSLTAVGCGGSSENGGGGGGGGTNPQPEVYTITLIAKDSVSTGITASTSFTLTVN
ncbi:MAG TPA: protease pro-enzyme activation domain-containing protein [Candidatus Aquilonibacter sp.]|nr:protease pro-enzyme activation domain-containing protein [Candidatus Aquilonibacter sp.]